MSAPTLCVDSRVPRTDWWAVGLVLCGGIVSAFHLAKTSIAARQLQTDLELSLGMLGGLSATFAVLGALGGVLAGSVVARAGDRRVLLLGLTATAAGSAMAVPADHVLVLLLSRVVEGLGFLLITVAGPTMLGRIARHEDQSTAFVLWSCFMPAGMALAMLIGPRFNDWRNLWTAAALASGCIAAMTLWTVPRSHVRTGVLEQPATLAAMWRSPALAMAATFMLYSLMFFALFSFLPVLLEQRMQVSPGAVGMLAAAASAVNMVGNLATRVLLEKVSRRALGTGAAVVMGLSAVGIFLPVLDPVSTFAMCMVFSAVGGLIPASLLSSVPKISSSSAQAALAMGLLMQGSNLGLALGPVVVGSAVDSHGWSAAAAWVVAAAMAMSGTVRWRAGGPRSR